jgi:hypothetical protein
MSPNNNFEVLRRWPRGASRRRVHPAAVFTAILEGGNAGMQCLRTQYVRRHTGEIRGRLGAI